MACASSVSEAICRQCSQTNGISVGIKGHELKVDIIKDIVKLRKDNDADVNLRMACARVLVEFTRYSARVELPNQCTEG